MQWEWAIFGPHRSKTTLPIWMKLETYNYRLRTTHRAKRNFDPTTWVVSANPQFAAVPQGFFLSLFLVSSSSPQVAPVNRF